MRTRHSSPPGPPPPVAMPSGVRVSALPPLPLVAQPRPLPAPPPVPLAPAAPRPYHAAPIEAAQGPAGLDHPDYDPDVMYDEQLGKIFTNMRLALKVSRETVARRLATSAFAIEAFETGTIASFPHWRECARIVRSYCELLRLDPEPILWRLRSHYHASGLPMGLVATPAAPRAEPFDAVQTQSGRVQKTVREDAPREGVRPSRRRRRRRRMLMALSAPLLVVGCLALLAQNAPGLVYGMIGVLPETVQGLARSSVDGVVVAVAPMREGLRWIDVGDPQLRKTDKLPTSKR